MPSRTHTSFQKRQRELARMEKQRDKAARRAQRKLAGPQPPSEEDALTETPAGEDVPTEPTEQPADEPKVEPQP